MLDANNYTFLINFRSDYNGSYIVNTQLSNNGLQALAKDLKARKKENMHLFDVYQFDRAKRKFSKITIKRFKEVTGFCTELSQVLNEINL